MLLDIVPHPKAPLFDGPDAALVFSQLMREVSSGSITNDETLRQAWRQAGYVNLWFFLKHIAAYAGPYGELNDNLHVDMCNFRQGLLRPGIRAGMFIPRSHYKTTIVTEGGTAWELLRDPGLAVRISNAIADFAHGFKLSVKAIYDNNELVRWLYGQKDRDGESYVPTSEDNWNKSVLIMPNRPRYRREYSIETGGATGAAESHHFDLHIVDDLIGMAALDGMRRANAMMYHAKNWFWANEDTLLTSPKKGRVVVVGTRYAIDDLYSEIIAKAHKVLGTTLRGFPYEEDRNPRHYKWQIYYRKAIEDGKVIFPENFTMEDYELMAKEKWWEYVTQYLNDPQESGLAELNAYTTKDFTMLHEDDQWIIEYMEYDVETDDYGPKRINLNDMDVVMAVDPAATEKYISAKTSKSAVGIVATSWDGKKFLIALRAGYYSPSQLFEEIFAASDPFRQYLRATFLEANAGFKVLGPLLREEERKRGRYIGLKPFASVGDKDARIRSVLQPELDAQRVFVHGAYVADVNEELRSFPQSHKKDILDMLSIAIANARQPISADEVARRAAIVDPWSRRPRNAVGY